MSYSKIVSGMPNMQTLWKRSTVFGSRVGPDAHGIYTGDRVQAPAGSTFYAPLYADTVDHKGYAPDTFTRASDGLYENQASEWQTAADNVARFENGMLLMEPASTNRCTAYSFPDAALTNYVKTSEGVMTRELGQPDEFSVLGNGYCVRLDTTGSGAARIDVGGNVGNLNQHAYSAWCRKISGTGQARLQSLTSNGVAFSNTEWERITFTHTPISTQEKVSLYCAPDVIAEFMFPQLEEIHVVTSPIVTIGASASRAVDALSYSGADGFFNQAQGMAVVTIRPLFDKADLSTTEGLLTVSSAVKENLLYFDAAFKSTDGTNTASVNTPAYVAGDALKLGVIYGPVVATALQVGYSLNGSAWVWSSSVPYDGGFVTDAVLAICTGVGMPIQVSDVVLYGENRGLAWVEANY